MMSITLQVSPELEKRLRQEAKEKGMQLDSYLTKFLEKSFTNRKKTNRTSKESELLKKINEGFPIDFWDRYKLLVKKRQEEKISTKELLELTQMTDTLEESNAKRMANLNELATIKQIPLTALMQQLGIKPHPLN